MPLLSKHTSKQRLIAEDLKNILDFLEVHILSHLIFFNHKLHDIHEENFYMEREWRVSRDVQFTLGDVQRIIIPVRFSRRLRRDFPKYDGEIVFGDA